MELTTSTLYKTKDLERFKTLYFSGHKIQVSTNIDRELNYHQIKVENYF